MLSFQWTNEPDMAAMQAAFNEIGDEAIFMSHYDLAKNTGISADQWKHFLTNPMIMEYLEEEVSLVQQAERRKMLQDISKKARSTGTAQTLAALNKIIDDDSQKSGPAFVYCYIPLNDQELHAPNVQVLNIDPFTKKHR